MQIKEVLAQLINNNGVSGEEFNASECAKNILSEYLDCHIDSFGNVYGTDREYDEQKETILLEAHIDEIGMIVTYITDSGFLKVSNCGGLDQRLLLAQQVDVICRDKIIKGVITSTPPHLEKDNSKSADIEDIFIDIGMSKEQAEKAVSLGDRVFINNELSDLAGDVVTAHAIDDRSGAAAILYALDMLKGKNKKYNINVLFSAQEEVGERGAEIGIQNLQPDIALIVDVSFARVAGDNPQDCGKMCCGPMIGIAPSLTRQVSEGLKKAAVENNIPYQIEVMNGKTGTDADVIGIANGGIKVCTVSIPLKYMHTPIETVNINDIENTAKLIAVFCESEEDL
ncbi:MAG: M42 family metallopeptidase [Oscillospiraceae bacterium]